MVKEIAIYLEGGGDKPETLTPFRRGMNAFLRPLVDAARKKRIRWRIIPCGGRSQTYDAFKNALKTEPDVFNVLLVDAEESVKDRNKPWAHLKQRKGGEWSKPAKATDEQCQLMVVTMETWFLADAEALTNLFRETRGFDASAFPAMPVEPSPPKPGEAPIPPKPATFLESKNKSAVNAIFKKAFKGTQAREYRKIVDGARMLEVVDPAKVRKQCPSCERLFLTLEKQLGF